MTVFLLSLSSISYFFFRQLADLAQIIFLFPQFQTFQRVFFGFQFAFLGQQSPLGSGDIQSFRIAQTLIKAAQKTLKTFSFFSFKFSHMSEIGCQKSPACRQAGISDNPNFLIPNFNYYLFFFQLRFLLFYNQRLPGCLIPYRGP